MKKPMFFAVLTLSILLNSVSDAATISVDQAGNGAFTTIGEGMAAAIEGDVLEVGPGLYEEGVVISKNITLTGAGPNFTTISSSSNGITVNSSVVTTISGFTITAAQTGLLLGSASSCTIRNNAIVANGGAAISKPYGSGSTLILNNVIAHNGGSGIYADSGYGSDASLMVRNTIVAFNGGYGIDRGNYVTVTLSHNDFYQNTSGNYVGVSAGSGDKAVDPKFISPLNGNYALQSTSPCIDAGSIGPTYLDADGSQNDMGAYGGPAAAAFWPYIPGAPVITELTVTPGSVAKGGTITVKAKARVE